MRKILVLRGGALGDFIVTLPALALLRERWPAARIELVGNARAAELAIRRSLIDAAHSQHEARWSALFADSPLPSELAAWLADFDLVLSYWPDATGELRRRFPLRVGQTFIEGAALPIRAPAAAHYCHALSPLGLSTQNYFFRLSSPTPGASLIALHPGSGSPRKTWPLDRWEALGAWLIREYRAELLIVTGEAEPAGTLAHLGTAAHHLPLDQLIARFANCRLFLGHDSGVSHLAAACGVPSLLLFGPTEPAMWAPPMPWVKALKRESEINTIALAEFQREIMAVLKPAGP